MAINNIFYTDNMTYLEDLKGNSITTTQLSITEAFNLARREDAQFSASLSYPEIVELSSWFQKKYDCINILVFYETCEEAGIKDLIPNFNSLELAKKLIRFITADYKISLDTINAYGTETYIANTLYSMLKEEKKNEDIQELLNLFDIIEDDNGSSSFNHYDLFEFLDKLKDIQKKNEKPIAKYKKAFKESWNCSSEAIEEYIEGIVTYGGDATIKIYKAMLEVLDDIEKDEGYYAVDKKGFVNAIQNNEYDI